MASNQQQAAPKPSPIVLLWKYKALIPTVLKTSASFYLFGGASPSWPIQVALFSALAQETRADSERRKLKRGKEPKPKSHEEVILAMKRIREATAIEKFTPAPTDKGIWAEVQLPVKKRGLPGVLKGPDGLESGSRTVPAEWSATNDTFDEAGKYAASDKTLLYFHGGGYVVMSPRSHRQVCLKMSRALNCRVLSVEYRLAPEHEFPAALHDAISAALHLVNDLNVPPGNIVVGGDSAGGGLSTATLLYLQMHPELLPGKLGGAILLSPYLDGTSSLTSWEQNTMFDYLPASPLSNPPAPAGPFDPMHLYIGRANYPQGLVNPLVSPILAPSELLVDFPPVLIQSGDLEALRDESILFALRLIQAQAGGKRRTDKGVRLEVWDGGIHVGAAFPNWELGKASFVNIENWSKVCLSEVVEGKADFVQVDELLRKGWQERSEKRAAKGLPARGRPTKEAPAEPAWLYTPHRDLFPALELRENAHPATAAIVKEVEGKRGGMREKEMASLALWRAERNENAPGVFSRVWKGIAHL